MTISQERIDRMVARWNELRHTDSTNDREKALFFREERRGYVTDGTNQFKADVNEYLTGISGAKALRFIEMLNRFRSQRDWRVLGGFSTLYYISGLDITTAQRNRLKVACRARADRDGQPITRDIARSIARDLGYESRRGRPTQTVMERKRAVLARFIWENHDDLPAEVIDAMPHEMQDDFAVTG